MRKFAFLPGAVMTVAAVSVGRTRRAVDRARERAARGRNPRARRRRGSQLEGRPGVVRRSSRSLRPEYRAVDAAAGCGPRSGQRPRGTEGGDFRLDRGGPQHARSRDRRAPAGPRDRYRPEADGQAEGPGVARPPRRILGENPRVRVETVDIDASPGDARRYGVTRAGGVVVEAGPRFRRIDAVTEPALASAILQVSSAVAPRVCFAAGEGGHGLSDSGSQGLSGLVSVLTASNYQVAPVSLLEGEIPADCSAVVIAGAPNGISADALTRLDAYLARGGRLLLALDPPVDPGVGTFFSRFGITAGTGVVIETSGAGRAVGAGPENPIASCTTITPSRMASTSGRSSAAPRRSVFAHRDRQPETSRLDGRHGLRTHRPAEPDHRIPRGP